MIALFIGALQLVESWPIETKLDHRDLPDAGPTWVEMMNGAKKSIDLAEFYATSAPNSELTKVIDALNAARNRGVVIRMLVDADFAKKPENDTLATLEKSSGWQIRRLDFSKRAGGILHAKYFIVDGEEMFIGSQNFDWRALTHIQELGLRFRSKEIAGVFADVFETDWKLAADAPAETRVTSRTKIDTIKIDDAEVTPVMSPKGWLTDERLWDLPRIIALLDGAKKTARVQLLTYKKLDELEDAVLRAAKRGVSVELLTSDWCKKKCQDHLRELDATPNITIKRVTIPEWTGGKIPYARVIHCKYLVVDGARAWLGTSNWDKDYFYGSRNIGLIINGGAVPPRLDSFFADIFNSDYASAP